MYEGATIKGERMDKDNQIIFQAILLVIIAIIGFSTAVMAQVDEGGGTDGTHEGTPGEPLPPDPENQGGNDTANPQQPAPENQIGTGAPPSSPDSTPGSGGSPDTYTPPAYNPDVFDTTQDTYVPPTYNPPAQLPGNEQPPETPTTQPAVCGNKVCEHGETTACPSDCQTTGQPNTGQPNQGGQPQNNQPGQGAEGITAMLDRTVPGGTIAVVGVIVVLIAIAGIFIYMKVNATE